MVLPVDSCHAKLSFALPLRNETPGYFLSLSPSLSHMSSMPRQGKARVCTDVTFMD